MKSLAKRACLSEGFARAAEAYKVEVASLTSERADLRAQVQHLSEDVAMHRLDLKHTFTGKSRAKEQEKKALDELRAVAYEPRMVEDELQIAREELKTDRGGCGLSRLDSRWTRKNYRRLGTSCVFQEISEAESTMGSLTDKCRGLRDDLQR